MTIFQCDKPPYFIFSNAIATWEWQLSQHILCILLEYIQFDSYRHSSQNSAGVCYFLRALHKFGFNFKIRVGLPKAILSLPIEYGP